MCVFIHIHTIAIRGQLSRSWFSPHVSPEDRVQVVRPGGKLLYLLSQSCQPPCSISLLKLLYYYKKPQFGRFVAGTKHKLHNCLEASIWRPGRERSELSVCHSGTGDGIHLSHPFHLVTRQGMEPFRCPVLWGSNYYVLASWAACWCSAPVFEQASPRQWFDNKRSWLN